jgi:FtsP/CotA-like multicopper oxidase with cupredoxin domain
MTKNTMSRRDFLRILGYGGVVLTGYQILSACSSFADEQIPNELQGDPDLEVRLIAKPGTQKIFPGTTTNVWRYTGEVINGPADTLISLPNSYLGPIFNVKTGTHLRVHFENQLPEKSIVHWHGLHVPDSADGHPRLAVESGETYTYDFRVMDRAGTYWYHPHPHGRTGPQVYYGLAGLFLIHDDEEASLNLPSQDQDIPIVIQDRYFDDDKQLVYDPSVMGMFGNQILVNGLPEYQVEVDRTAYRLRLMNGSNARIYKLAWSDGSSLQVIGTEGGLLEKPLSRDYITLAPAQRIDLWVDFGAWDPGSVINLVNLSDTAQDAEEEFIIFSARIKDTERVITSLPESFPQHQKLDASQAVNPNSPRTFELQMGMGMRWTINGRVFDMTDVASDEEVQLGDTEIWEFSNQGTGMGGMGMGGMLQPHPMHIHALQFKILDRQVDPRNQDTYNGLKDGFVDEGWHDTVLVMPGERVRLLMQFTDFSGLYLYHCHNLEHEDMGMMRNYEVKNS